MSDEAIRLLSEQVAELTRRLTVQEDVQAVRSLQFKYGYYLDKGLYDEVVDLFAANGELHFLGGIFRGKAGLRRLYCDRLRGAFADGHNGPVYGLLADHLQLQDIVDIGRGGTTAKGRFRVFLQAGSHATRETIGSPRPRQWWEAGVYENDYVKEAGVWRIKTLDYHLVWQADYETGWAHSPPHAGRFFEKTYPEDPAGPDALSERVPGAWPETPLVDFHYNHPVTGKPWIRGRSDGRRKG